MAISGEWDEERDASIGKNDSSCDRRLSPIMNRQNVQNSTDLRKTPAVNDFFSLDRRTGTAFQS